MQNHVAVYEIKPVSVRRVFNPFPTEDCRQWTLLAVEIRDVSGVMSLLQHVRAARKISDPRPSLSSPRVIAIKPEPIRAQRQPRRHIRHGLMRGLMNLEAVHTLRKLQVGNFF